MIRSMTAFARREVDSTWGTLTWELRSLNHRYLETSIRLPDELRGLEQHVRERAAKSLKRGKVECNLRFRPHPLNEAPLRVNEQGIDRLLQACQLLDQRERTLAPINPLDVLRWPGVVEEPERDFASLGEQALTLFAQSLDDLVETRMREGAQIRELIAARCNAMEPLVTQARQRLPDIKARVRERLLARLEEIGTSVENGRLEQELVFLAQKMDVDEELDRLEGHVEEVRRVLERKEPVGRRLDFLMQELNREANTLGSKSADKDTTAISVELKVLIEQMREQVQNIE